MKRPEDDEPETNPEEDEDECGHGDTPPPSEPTE